MSKKPDLGLKSRLRDADAAERATIIDGLPYHVGFGKPPVKNRFSSELQPGKRGRSKGSKNLATQLQEALETKIEVIEAGKRKRRTKISVAMTQAANKAAQGDLKALALLLETSRKTGQLQDNAPQGAPVFDAKDIEAITRIVEMLSPNDDDAQPKGAVS